MKACHSHLLAAAAALLRATAVAQSSVPTPSSASTTTVSATATSSGGESPGPIETGSAICGQGFTYCGYILKEHQGFPETDIIKAYCNGAADNCDNGTTKSDPIQALYICLPPNASPRHAMDDGSMGGGKVNMMMADYGDIDDEDVENRRNWYHKEHGHREHGQKEHGHKEHGYKENGHKEHGHKHHGEEHSHTAMPRGMDLLRSAFRSNSGSHKAESQQQQQQWGRRGMMGHMVASSSSAAPTAPASGGGQCSTAPVTGNRIELLCICQGSGSGKTGPCMDPDVDHTGRCRAPP